MLIRWDLRGVLGESTEFSFETEGQLPAVNSCVWFRDERVDRGAGKLAEYRVERVDTCLQLNWADREHVVSQLTKSDPIERWEEFCSYVENELGGKLHTISRAKDKIEYALHHGEVTCWRVE